MKSGCAVVAVMAVLATVLLGGVQAQIQSDLITNLPGAGNLSINYQMYSGYITLNSNGRHYFYWFLESQNDPTTDPLLLWLNGGPGCSSLGGLLSENGPFYPDADKNLVANPYGWNTVANVLYLESPAGVGFSYEEGETHFTDNKTAADNYEFLQQWFQAYPQYANNDFYITGESYAGHYIPDLTYQIYLATKTDPNSPPQSNFKGFMVGNPSTDNDIDFGTPLTDYYRTHGMIPLDGSGDPAGNVNPYDILVDVCEGGMLLDHIRFPHPLIDKLREAEAEKPRLHRRYVPNPPACIDNYVQKYLNDKEVQDAIHAYNKTHWVDCGGPPYTFGPHPMIPYYETFMEDTNYKILEDSGDADTVINFLSTETWILGLKRKVVNPWAPWYYKQIEGTKQVAGWGVDYDRISYRTVKGAGHMVPWFQPAPALELLKSFLAM